MKIEEIMYIYPTSLCSRRCASACQSVTCNDTMSAVYERWIQEELKLCLHRGKHLGSRLTMLLSSARMSQ